MTHCPPQIRRHHLPATIVLMLGILTLASVASTAMADALPVSVTTLQQSDGYAVNRRYAGVLSHLRTSDLGFEARGPIAAFNVSEGDRVKQGAPLVLLDTKAAAAQLRAAEAAMASAEANVLAQQAQHRLALSSLKRYEDLVAKGHGSVQRLDELQIQGQVDEARLRVAETTWQSAEAERDLMAVQLDKLQIRAPFDGIVQARQVDEGSMVSPGQPVLTLVDSANLEVRVGVPENMVRHLQPGNVYVFDVAGRRADGQLRALLPIADPITGTVTALFQLDEPGLYAGTVAELQLQVMVQEPGYWLPLSALAESQRGLWSVLVVETEGSIQRVSSRLVEVIHRGVDEVYVRGTLQPGESVVASGTGRIVAGQQVQVTDSVSMTGNSRFAAQGADTTLLVAAVSGDE